MFGIDLIVDVDDVGVIKITDDLADGVAFTDVGEELVTETFALAGARYQTGDVGEFDDSGDDFLRFRDLG